MAAPTIFRSSDANAPQLTGAPGSMLAVLNGCLVNGYGSVKATAVVHSDGTTVANNDTITIDGTVYTWKTALTPAAGEVLIGASAATNLSNLAAAVSRYGVENTNYGTGTAQQTRLQVTSVTATDVTLTAFRGGAGGNAIALSTTATHVTVPANFSGGSGSDTTAALGWGSPFTGTNKAVYRAATGVRHFLDVDDSGPNATALGRNSGIRGYETMSAPGTGTNPFPTVAQQASPVITKSNTLDSVVRPWILIGDGLTFYFWTVNAGTNPPNLGTNTWKSAFQFGEFFSILSGDLYRSFIGVPQNTANATTDSLGSWYVAPTSSASTADSDCNCPRTYLGTGPSIWVSPVTNLFWPINGGVQPFPNAADGGLYMSHIGVIERGNGASAAAFNTLAFRGRFRGFYQQVHNVTAFNDQDTFSGVGDFSGRAFLMLKTAATTGNPIETTAWESSV